MASAGYPLYLKEFSRTIGMRVFAAARGAIPDPFLDTYMFLGQIHLKRRSIVPRLRV